MRRKEELETTETRLVSMECARMERSSEHRSRLMAKSHTLAASPDQETLPRSNRRESSSMEKAWKKMNFPDGTPIEDQSDDDDGYWM